MAIPMPYEGNMENIDIENQNIVRRDRRFDPNLDSVQFYQPMNLNDASASG